jgi:thymidylate synthase
MEEAEYTAGLKERIIESADPEDIRRVEIKKGKAVNKDTAYGLAQHFREQVTNTGADWSSGLTHNAVGSLSKHFAQWQRDGKTADQIRAMVNVFVTEPAMRDVRVTTWKDFLAKRDRLYDAMLKREKAQEMMKDHSDDPSYWTGL